MGRMYVASTPATRGEVEEKSSTAPAVGPEGRFYLASDDKAAEKARVSDPVAAAAAFGGQPPSKDEVRNAKKEQKAAEEAASKTAPADAPPPADPAAETVQEEPVAAAGDQAGEPPVETTNPPSGNAARDKWVAYAKEQHGATDEELESLSRNDIRDKYGLL